MGCPLIARMPKIVSAFIVLCLVAVCAGALWSYIHSIPPKDAALVKQFYAHRGDFERLRAMLQQDSNISIVATSWISTKDRYGVAPQQAGISNARYKEYLANLKNAGALLAAHSPGEFYFLVARWGFAGSGWGIAVVSIATAPTNRLASVDDYFAGTNSSPDGDFRHIEGDWYLWIK